MVKLYKGIEGRDIWFLEAAHAYALTHTGCTKVAVGSVIMQGDNLKRPMTIYGANRAIPNVCIGGECLRVQKYGDNDKSHRAPDDCHAIHSEIDAICNAAKMGLCLKNATIFVSRYPCEGCARAIVASGITRVVYGRETPISAMTAAIFGTENVQAIHRKDFNMLDATN